MRWLYFTLLLLLPTTFLPLPVEQRSSFEEVCPPTQEDSLFLLSIHLLKKMEGLRLSPYKCPGGVRTIGYGHTKTAKQFKTIMPQQADSLLIADFVRSLNVTWKLAPNLELGQRYAFAMFVFNVGEYKLRKTQTLSLIQKGYEPSFNRWVHAKGKRLKGLEKRRKIETEMFRDWRLTFHKEFIHL